MISADFDFDPNTGDTNVGLGAASGWGAQFNPDSAIIYKGPDGAESGEFCRGAKPPGPPFQALFGHFCPKPGFRE